MPGGNFIALNMLIRKQIVKTSPPLKYVNQVFNSSNSAAAAAKLLQSRPTLRPHRRPPTRLLCPWDSPGKNTGVGWPFLLQCLKVKSESEVAQSCRLLATPCTAAYQAPPSMGFSRQEYWSGVPMPSLTTLLILINLGAARWEKGFLTANA